jgi:hypothetical protein
MLYNQISIHLSSSIKVLTLINQIISKIEDIVTKCIV